MRIYYYKNNNQYNVVEPSNDLGGVYDSFVHFHLTSQLHFNHELDLSKYNFMYHSLFDSVLNFSKNFKIQETVSCNLYITKTTFVIFIISEELLNYSKNFKHIFKHMSLTWLGKMLC